MEVTQNFELLQSDHPKPAVAAPVQTPLMVQGFRLIFRSLGYLMPKRLAKLAFKLFTTPPNRAKHRISDDVLESAKVFEFLYQKYLLKAYEWGSGDKTILLVHGWRSRGTALRSFVPGLVSKGYRVVTFDGMGHGDSPGTQMTLPSYAGSIHAIVKHLGGVSGIIAHSFGGASSVFAMDQYADLCLDTLVLVASPSSMRKMADQFLNYMKAPLRLKQAFYKILESKVNRSIDEVQVSLSESYTRVGALLLVHDQHDLSVPFSAAKTVFEHWPNSSLLATDGYGHFQILKNPDVVKRVVDFV